MYGNYMGVIGNPRIISQVNIPIKYGMYPIILEIPCVEPFFMEYFLLIFLCVLGAFAVKMPWYIG